MTAEKLVAQLDAVKPNGYTLAQKLVWLDDMEAEIWRDVFLAPAELWQYAPVGSRVLMLPESYRRLYTMYLTAMIDFSNGEYGKYSNAMAAYNSGYTALAADYSARFCPANGGPVRAKLGKLTYNDAGQSCTLATLPAGCAVLGTFCRVATAFNGSAAALTLGTQEQGERLLTRGGALPETAGIYLQRQLYMPGNEKTTICALCQCSAGTTAGEAEFELLLQPGKER